MVKVTLPERGGVESGWISVPSFEYDMPEVKDQVEVTLDEDGYSSGLCHGLYFSDTNAPKVQGTDIYYKTMKKDLVIQYDRACKTLTITADNISIIGNISVAGDVSISGSLDVSGAITAASVTAGFITEGG